MTDNLITTASQQDGGPNPLLKSKLKPQDSIFFNLNDYVKSRLLYDMLTQKILPNCRESSKYVILVVDDVAMEIISNFCTTFDLMESGNIY
jgi:hypothetical protein